MARKIKITIHKDGTQKVEAIDTLGEECVELTRAFEERLGDVEGERVFKPEYTMTEQELEQERDRERE